MKLSVNVEADAINVLALNMGRIVVDIDGIELSELIPAVNQNGCTLRIADKPGSAIVESSLLPLYVITGDLLQYSPHHCGRQFAAVCPVASG